MLQGGSVVIFNHEDVYRQLWDNDLQYTVEIPSPIF